MDLLFTMCDSSNAASIVDELVKYLTIADFSMREELVLKVAILAEKYAPNVQVGHRLAPPLAALWQLEARGLWHVCYTVQWDVRMGQKRRDRDKCWRSCNVCIPGKGLCLGHIAWPLRSQLVPSPWLCFGGSLILFLHRVAASSSPILLLQTSYLSYIVKI